jgi:hypothetical protein
MLLLLVTVVVVVLLLLVPAGAGVPGDPAACRVLGLPAAAG